MKHTFYILFNFPVRFHGLDKYTHPATKQNVLNEYRIPYFPAHKAHFFPRKM